VSADQRAKIQPMFRELIRLVAYPKSGVFLKNAQIALKAGKRESDVATIEMKASLPKEDLETSIVFHWQDKAGTLRIVDVSFDGSSLVKDYRNQFGRIIDKDGIDGLIKKMSTRLEQERKKQGF
jgi:phospholipid transport system substrate-binding protein